MKAINKRAQKVFDKLIDGLKVGEAKVIGEKGGAFMQVHVDVLRISGPGVIISVAHYYQQNGDMMADPDVEFYFADGKAYPVTFTQAPTIFQELVEFKGGKPVRFCPRQQRDVAEFCGTWMDNIRDQQQL